LTIGHDGPVVKKLRCLILLNVCKLQPFYKYKNVIKAIVAQGITVKWNKTHSDDMNKRTIGISRLHLCSKEVLKFRVQLIT